MAAFKAGLVSATAAREEVANKSSGEVSYTATFAADYVPNVRYERRAVLPITIILSGIFILAIVFQIIACASNEWASFDHGEMNNWGLWEGCNEIVGCFSLMAPRSLLYISENDRESLKVCQAFSILCVLLLTPAWGLIIMTHKRNYTWGLYAMGVLALWLISWIICIVKFTKLEMFTLYSVGTNMPKSSFFAAGMIMHIIGLILVITAVIILWGSCFICFAVDIYDDYGIKIASREDPPEYNAALTINKHMISGELDNRQGY